MVRERDPAWNYCEKANNSHNVVKCLFCNKTMMGGGITRFKKHLAGTDRNFTKCPKCGPEVRKEYQERLESAAQKKAALAYAEKESTNRLLDISDEEEEQQENSDEDEDEKQEMCDLRAAKKRSVAKHWEDEQIHRLQRSQSTFAGSTREMGSSSTARNKKQSTIDQHFRTGSVRQHPIDLDTRRLRDPYQQTIPQQLKKGKVGGWGKTFRTLFTKMVHHGGINPHQITNNPYTQPMVDSITNSPGPVKIPTAYELYGSGLKEVKKELLDYIEGVKYKKWAIYGVTIMCDGWTGPTKHSLMNFMVYCNGVAYFIKSEDLSAVTHSSKELLNRMKAVIDEVGKKYVVQIVTDNGANYKKAAEDLCNLPGYHMFWTGCAAHSIDLILKDFCRRKSIAKRIATARKITKYIYNHIQVCDLMRECCNGDLVRPALTRFTTNFLALQSLFNKLSGLKIMIIHDKWVEIKRRTKDPRMTEIEDIVNDCDFWRKIKSIIDTLEPIVQTLRLVDKDTTPTMGYIFKWIKNMIEKVYNTPRCPEWVEDLINDRWTKQLSHTLHKAGELLHIIELMSL